MNSSKIAHSGVEQLGYLGFEVKDPAAWASFATDVLGLTLAERRPDGGFSLRIDGHAQRFVVEPGPADDVSVVGWQVTDAGALREVERRARALGADVVSGSAQEASARRVKELVKFRDPGGVPTEVYWGPEIASEPLPPNRFGARFVAEERGLGHVVVSAKDKAESVRFYQEALGFRLSDHIQCEYFGYQVDLSFFHANPRHHSLAIGGPQRKRIHHFMVEVAAMDDVGLCFDRALAAGVPIMQTLGRHPNDRMFSFYAKTPSGFQFEYGWGAREVDDAVWQPTTYHAISEWGHHPPVAFAPKEKKPI